MATLEEYKGSIDLISGLRAKNNGAFPLLEAHDILVGADDLRLDEKLANIGEGGASEAIIDVNELPTENINEDVFYRVLVPYGFCNGVVQAGVVYVVDTLPETGEPCTTDGQTFSAGYYNKADGAVYGYVNATIGTVLGVPAGWYPAANLFVALGIAYGGVIDSEEDATAKNTFYFVLDYSLYSYKTGWQPVKSVGWKGTGSGGEKFNSYLNEASGECSHAQGRGTTASGDRSHAEGFHTTASGYASHAEGYYTTASSDCSHAEGYHTTASGDRSHAEGSGTTASGECSHAQGKYNIEDTENKYAHIVGNGVGDTSRSNAHTLDWDGNAWFAGKVKIGGTGYDDANAVELGAGGGTAKSFMLTYNSAETTDTSTTLKFTGVTNTVGNKYLNRLVTKITAYRQTLAVQIQNTQSVVGAGADMGTIMFNIKENGACNPFFATLAIWSDNATLTFEYETLTEEMQTIIGTIQYSDYIRVDYEEV